ncbi:MAG: hypothetical protein ACK4N5_13800, partial [Myxococcales bacterium]
AETIEQPAVPPPVGRQTTEELGSPAPAPTAETASARPHARKRRSDTVEDAAFDASDLDPAEHAATSHDWHVPPAPPPPPPEKPKVGVGSWLTAFAAFAALAAVAYFLVERRLGLQFGTGLSALGSSSAESRMPAPVRPDDTPEPVAPAQEKARTRPAARDDAAGGTLTLETDVPAQVFLDGRDTGTQTPLKRFPLAAGPHTVLLVTDAGQTRELRVEIASGEDLRRTEVMSADGKAPAKKSTTRKRSR